jgi:hypothetical protein
MIQHRINNRRLPLFLFLFLLSLSFARGAQKEKLFKHEVSLSPYKLEYVSESYNHEFIGKPFNSLYLDYYCTEKLAGFIGLGYGKY